MDTTFRRRMTGRGSRTARKKRAGELSVRERRRLIQLAASFLLFLLVFFGRGVLPEQMAVWKAIICADMDLKGAVTAFGAAVSDGGNVLEALDELWAGLTGTEEPEVQTDSEINLPLPEPVSYVERAAHPSFGMLYAIEPLAESAAEASGELEEPVVTAVAQQYDDKGNELPDNVSLEYYNLGLEETATPVMGSVTSAFGFRDHPVSGAYTFHTAVDIGVSTGTDVLAYADGTVRYIGENDTYGLYLMLDHANGVSTFYAHCEELLVRKGDTVTCGQVIAKSGETGNATGPHLHFSIEKDGVKLNPAYYLNFE